MKYGLSDSVIFDLQSVFRAFPEIEEVKIFGSRAKGNYREGSDIDLALISKAPIPFADIMDINIKINDLGLLYKVDLVDYSKKKGTPLGSHIDRVGKPLY